MNPWFNEFYRQIAQSPLSSWLEVLPAQLATWTKQQKHGDFDKWVKLLGKLPKIEKPIAELTNSVTISAAAGTDEYTKKQIEGLLRQFSPWRKGPFSVHDVFIDTEWRSDWKWDRVKPHLSPLTGKQVLDIGCGSGYHMWRMLAQDPAMMVGVDPTQLFLMQFQAIKHFNPDPRIHLLPVGGEDVPPLKAFDTVFCMGVLYHRRSPIDFLQHIRNTMVKGGELILETLVIEGDINTVLVPGERYAQMRNVWFIPSTDALCQWLQRCGYQHVEVVDLNQTSVEEQRATSWMQGQSLSDFLDPNDHNLTIEGYPAPLRAVIKAIA